MEKEKIDLIKVKLRQAADEFIESIPDESIRVLFKENSFIAGGAIASLVLEEEPNDLDFYFKNTDACYLVANYYLKQMDMDHNYHIELLENGLSIRIPKGVMSVDKQEGEKYQPVVLTANAISLTDGVQIIIRYTGNSTEIADSFDYLHTKGIYDYKEDQLIIPLNVLEAIKLKRLTYTGSVYPIASLIRSRKFLKRDFSINAGQYLKMAIEINNLDLSDPAVVREQLVGVDLLIFDALLHALDDKKKGKIDDSTFEEKFDWLFDLIDKAFDQIQPENPFEE